LADGPATGQGERVDQLFEVRRAQDDDVPAMVALLAAVAGEGRWLGTEAGFDPEVRAERFRGQLADPRSASFLAVAGDQLVGNLGIHLLDHGVAELGMLVALGWRGRGVGSALLGAAIEWARQMGAHKVALQCWPHNVAALGLYERFGFVREGYLVRHYPRSNGEIWDAVVMGLQTHGGQ
jgi:RimJ/RimL family protein N-acetyltransferase